MPSARRISLTLCVAAALLVAGACGGDGGDGGGDEDGITAAIEGSATGTDPSICTELQTQAFNEQLQRETGEAAVTECEDGIADGNADSVQVSQVEVTDDTATANAAVTGGNLDGQTVTLALVKEGDQWKLDRFTGFAEFDAGKLLAVVVGQLRESLPDAPPPVVECLLGQLRSLSSQELQDLFLSGSNEGFEQLFAPCLQ